jgi:hypothetical protein
MLITCLCHKRWQISCTATIIFMQLKFMCLSPYHAKAKIYQSCQMDKNNTLYLVYNLCVFKTIIKTRGRGYSLEKACFFVHPAALTCFSHSLQVPTQHCCKLVPFHATVLVQYTIILSSRRQLVKLRA